VYATLIDAATLNDRLNSPGWCIVDPLPDRARLRTIFAAWGITPERPPVESIQNPTPYPEQEPLTEVVEVHDLLEERTGRVLLDACNADRFAGPEQLRQRFAPVVDGATQVVCYCGSGVTAAHNILALRIAGFDEPALYAGSWSEWIQDATRPRGP
jgi:3-mercaptopyruvate sulfurtransferase SseA